MAVGRLMAMMFPILMLVLNASSVAGDVVRRHRIGSGDLQVGALTAFQSYLMQILMAVMMATFMFMLLPRAEVSRRADHRGTRDRPECRGRRPTPVRSRSSAASIEMGEPSSAFPARSTTCCTDRPGRAARRDHRDHRLDGQWQVDVAQPDPAAVRRDRRGGARRRRTTSDARSRAMSGPRSGSCRSGPTCSPAPWRATCVTDAPTRPTTSCGTRCEIAQADGLRRAHARAAQRADRARRHQCLGRAAATARDRPRSRASGRAIYLFDDSFSALDYATDAALRAALRPGTADATVVIVAQRVSTIRDADRIVVLDEGRVVGTGTHHELMADLRRPTARSCCPSSPKRRRHEWAGGPPWRDGGCRRRKPKDFRGSVRAAASTGLLPAARCRLGGRRAGRRRVSR